MRLPEGRGVYRTPWLPSGHTLTITAGPSQIGLPMSSTPRALAEKDDVEINLALAGGGALIQGTVTGGGNALSCASLFFVPGGGAGASTGGSGAFRTLAMPVAPVTANVQPPYGQNFVATSRSVTLVPGANTLNVDLAVSF